MPVADNKLNILDVADINIEQIADFPDEGVPQRKTALQELDETPLPPLDESFISGNSDEFQDILNRYKYGGNDVLGSEERDRLKNAAKAIPQIDAFVSLVDQFHKDIESEQSRQQEEGAQDVTTDQSGYSISNDTGGVIKQTSDLEGLPGMLQRFGRDIEQWIETPTKIESQVGTENFIAELTEASAKGLLKFPAHMAEQWWKDANNVNPVYASIKMAAGLVDFPFRTGQDIASVIAQEPISRGPIATEAVERFFPGGPATPAEIVPGATPDEIVEQWKKDPTPLILAALPILKVAKSHWKKYDYAKPMLKQVTEAELAMEKTLKRTKEFSEREIAEARRVAIKAEKKPVEAPKIPEDIKAMSDAELKAEAAKQGFIETDIVDMSRAELESRVSIAREGIEGQKPKIEVKPEPTKPVTEPVPKVEAKKPEVKPKEKVTPAKEVAKPVAKVKPKPEPLKPVTEIVPIEERGAGINVLNPFPTKSQQLSNAIKKAESKKNLDKAQSEIVDKAPTIQFEEKPKDAQTILQRPSHKFGSVPDEYGEMRPNYGMAAAETHQKLMLLELDIRKDQGAGIEEFARVVNKMSRKERKKYSSTIVDFIEKPIEETAKSNLPDNIKKVITDSKKLFDTQKKEIIDIKRKDVRPFISKSAEQQFREINNLEGKTLSESQRLELNNSIDAMVKAEIPDDWGVKDYFRHLFEGDLAIYRDGEFIGSGINWSEVVTKVAEDNVVFERPEGTPAPTYNVKVRQFNNPDVIRVSNSVKYKTMAALAKELEIESPTRLNQIIGKHIGTKAGQRKFAGFLQERKGAGGYSKDFEFVMNYHTLNYNRWKNLYKSKQEIQPLIDKIRQEGRPLIADEMQLNLDILWGKHQTATSKMFDAFLDKYSRGRARPFALERAVGTARSLDAFLRLKTKLSFNLLNSLQILQTGMVVPYRDLAWAQKAIRTAEGKALLDKHRVFHAIQGAGGELTKNITSAKIRSANIVRALRLSPETSNQAEMWLAAYRHARKTLGKSESVAAEYGFLRGMVYSQFLPLKTNKAMLLKNKAVGIGPGMYRSFMIGAMELGYDLARGTIKGPTKRARLKSGLRLAHYVAAQLSLGGTKALLSTPTKFIGGGYITLELYNRIKDEYGEDVANIIHFGLPSLINADISASVQVADLPFAETIPEAVGDILLGPIGGTAVRAFEAGLDKGGLETSTVERVSREVANAYGGTRQLLGLEKVWSGDYDFKSPNGKKQFTGDLKDALVQSTGARPLHSSIQSLNMDALFEVKKDRDDYLNRASNRLLKMYNENDYKEAEEVLGNIINEFNSKYPDITDISITDIIEKTKGKIATKDLTSFERSLEHAGKRFQILFMDQLGEE